MKDLSISSSKFKVTSPPPPQAANHIIIFVCTNTKEMTYGDRWSRFITFIPSLDLTGYPEPGVKRTIPDINCERHRKMLIKKLEPTVSVSFCFLHKSLKNSCYSHCNKDTTDLCISSSSLFWEQPIQSHFTTRKREREGETEKDRKRDRERRKKNGKKEERKEGERGSKGRVK